MRRPLLSIALAWLIWLNSFSQKIIDPCFISTTEIGYFTGSEDLKNVCDCSEPYKSANLLVWNGSSWDGALPGSDINIVPPPGCNLRAMWMGDRIWTKNGEAFAMRLDKPLEAGKQVSFTFTYAAAGVRSYHSFNPAVYTTHFLDNSNAFENSFKIAHLPNADDWRTETLTFTTREAQAGHDWLILHAAFTAGIVLSNCDFQELPPDFLGVDSIFCNGTTFQINAPKSEYFEYLWSTNATTESITVNDAGPYAVTIKQGGCSTSDEISLEHEDCEVRLKMPNIFTPNGDEFNPMFVPEEYNYLESGNIVIYNRWGEEIFNGDLFTGWDGRVGSSEASSGVYYFRAFYTDKYGGTGLIDGPLTLTR